MTVAATCLGFTDARISLADGARLRVLATTRVRGRTRLVAMTSCDAAVVSQRRPVAVESLADQADHPDAARGRYLGVPLVAEEFGVWGVLGLSDPVAGLIGETQVRQLLGFAGVVSDQLELLRQVVWDQGLQAEVADVARAVADGEIVPWYQPIVDLRTQRVIGMEALARWQRPSGEIIEPAAFIALAERSDLIADLDMSVIRQALADFRGWQRAHPGLRLSVNVSGRDLDNGDWLAVIGGMVAEAGVSASSLDLELTETARPHDAAGTRVMLERARALGFRVWFDDFGSGLSALQDLIELPVDGIKIDRAFADALGTHDDDAIIRALTGAATELGLVVTIEGVETAEQAAQARNLGCDFAQGYLWARPVPAAEVDTLLAPSSEHPT